MGCIYLATNTVNGKKYVGKTLNTMERRRAEHIREARRPGRHRHFHLALAGHGANSFAWEVLCESEDNDELSAMEQFYISHLKTATPSGYNLTVGGDGAILNTEQRKRKSEARKALQKKDPLRYEIARTVTNRLTDEQKAAKADKCRQKALEQFKDPEKYARFLECTRKVDRSGPKKKKSMTKTRAAKIFAEINSQIKKAHREHDRQVERQRIESSPTYAEAMHRRTKRPVLCVDTNETFPSAYHAASAKDICRMNITQVCLGKKKSAGGHQWKYI